jgi:hypothetical protein
MTQEQKYKEPTAEVVTFHKEGSVARIVLKFDVLPSSPIAPASLHTNTNADIKITLHKQISGNGNEIEFECYDVGDISLATGDIYIVRSWWSPDQLEIAQDPKTSNWKRLKFTPSDALEVQTPEGYRAQRKLEQGEVFQEGTIIPNCWEHEHCALCWKTISAYPDEDNYGYTDGSSWICDKCFETFIVSGLGQKLG